MPRSPLVRPLRAGLRGARVALRTTRDVADLGLVVVDFAARALGEPGSGEDADAPPGRPTPPRRRSPTRSFEDEAPGASAAPGAPIVGSVAAWEDEEAELVEAVAEPGAEDGAGASIRIEAPLPGYDALRAPDVIALAGGADVATLAAIELYEQAHRARRTVLDAVTRELSRRR